MLSLRPLLLYQILLVFIQTLTILLVLPLIAYSNKHRK